MRFQTKMNVMYAIFMLVIASILGMFYYNYNMKQYIEAEENNLWVSANQLVVQMDELIKPMELTMNYILSDAKMLEAIRLLSNDDEVNISTYSVEAKRILQSGLNTDFIIKNFNRTIIFNQLGYVVSSYSDEGDAKKHCYDFSNQPWLLLADKGLGVPVLVNDHIDVWGVENETRVFSLLKAVQGTNMGYVEVQKKVSDLADHLFLPKEGMNYMIKINSDELLYSSKVGISDDAYMVSGKIENEFVVTALSDNYDISVTVIGNISALQDQNEYIIPITILFAGIFYLVSMFFILLLSQFLTKPIRKLRLVMEETEISNLGYKSLPNTSYDEIEALNISYMQVLERLKESIIKEKHLSLLQLQAQFDLLQSQVNPHFLYNVLNVISARGMKNSDEIICEMCGSLAMMMRYSTNNKTRHATIQEELTYLRQYFYILKSSYEHRIEFEVDIEDSLYLQIIPKITLQQIVENAINHGFESSTNTMILKLKGWQVTNRWYIKISDNGQGFSHEAMIGLEKKFKAAKKLLLEDKNSMELEIGGMGLVNTYARLLLLYPEDLIFDFRNSSEGAEVIISATMNKECLYV